MSRKKSRDATSCEHTHAQLKKTIYRSKYTSQKVATKVQRFSSYVGIFRQEFGVSRLKSQSQYTKNMIDSQLSNVPLLCGNVVEKVAAEKVAAEKVAAEEVVAEKPDSTFSASWREIDL